MTSCSVAEVLIPNFYNRRASNFTRIKLYLLKLNYATQRTVYQQFCAKVCDPCFSNPCLNGGTCISNTSEFTYRCDCSLQIAVLAYINDHCAVDTSQVQVSGVYNRVFHVRVMKAYSMNYYEAERACSMFGAKMASLQQLRDGWKVGFQMCSYGWLIDGTSRYPIFYQPTVPGCGMDPPSIRGSTVVHNKNTSKFDVYCYKEIVNHHHHHHHHQPPLLPPPSSNH
ncbi:hypothetical protein QZH41_020503 [Actinostola sp. cb2023]|nr:hypothetical protein QZH41_020503 [Actinostola sp. cb2023]